MHTITNFETQTWYCYKGGSIGKAVQNIKTHEMVALNCALSTSPPLHAYIFIHTFAYSFLCTFSTKNLNATLLIIPLHVIAERLVKGRVHDTVSIETSTVWTCLLLLVSSIGDS